MATPTLVYNILSSAGESQYDRREDLITKVNAVITNGGHAIGGVIVSQGGVYTQAVMMRPTSGGNRKTRSRRSKTRRSNRKY